MSQNNWLEDQLQNPPDDFTDKVFASIYRASQEGRIHSLDAEKEVGLFCLYLMGDSYENISEKTGWSLDTVAITALKYRWYEKRGACSVTNESEGAQQVLKGMLSNMLAATAHEISRQTKDIMSGKIDASECKIIPKGVRELQQFVQVVSQVYQLESKKDQQGTVVNVNVAQVSNGQQQVTANTEPIKVIEQAKPEDRLAKFKILRESEEKVKIG
jgi:hypothetical protein